MNGRIAFLILILAIVLMFTAITGIGWAVNTYKDKSRRKKHPELYQWFKEVDELGTMSCHWYNREIAPLKRKVDRILADFPYYPQEEKILQERILEELRQEIHEATLKEKQMDKEREIICDKIRKYVADNNLKWAKQWGW